MSVGIQTRRLTREVIAQRDIGRTEISPRLAWLLNVAFLLTLAVPPIAQLLYDVYADETHQTPSCLELFDGLPDVVQTIDRTQGSLWERMIAANRQLRKRIDDYERQLEDRSLMTRHLLGPTQSWLTAWGGLGNEKVYVGRSGWLFYRPDVDYLTGPGFLEPAVLERRARGGKDHTGSPAADPRPAIFDFHQQLARRDITLVLMPTPGKAALHPEKFSARFDLGGARLNNASFEQFQRDMEAAGVLLFDPAPFLTERGNALNGSQQFLETDTHWTPEAMQFVAEQLAAFIDSRCPLPTRRPMTFGERRLDVENLGDIAVMLHLPDHQTLFPRERVKVRQISNLDGWAWSPDETADVLLLGDSYTNIYSLREMHWGAAAGLAEQLAFAMHRPVDRLAQNDGGAYAVRQTLVRELAGGRNRLAGKRVVVWQFAARELAFGDWKVLPLLELALPDDGVQPKPPDLAAVEVVIQGTVIAAAGAPRPGSVPYRDAVTALHLGAVEAVEGDFPNREIVVFLWGLRDNRLTDAARVAPGQKVSLRVVPWASVRESYERFNRIELDDPDFRLAELPTYWGEKAP
jgi:alginate O-acetyltransferase complex protein AlgJ